ncbi:hypothetical protein [Sphingomonas sp.]|uniref:hypothetical protein n=1 Tax=Sphingomonas sp. TaxID=28214 RepID=UPI0017ADBE2F|nr:hypothetical protein [Sphingomonas sp.]MBA3511113.1 hypothetical protein [Sphingomonas sp.]
MTDTSTDLERTIMKAYRLAVRSEQLPVAEHLLGALKTLADKYPKVEDTINEALLMIEPRGGRGQP